MKNRITISFAIVMVLGSFMFSGNPIMENARAGTPKQGVLLADETWTLTGSPYLIEGDLIVGNGVNLTIEPGVEVKVNKGYGIYVNGNLTATGAEMNRIKITTNSIPILPGDWKTIEINASGRAVISYADISWCRRCIYLNSSSNNTIENNNITLGQDNGIHLLSSSNNSLSNNIFANNKPNGIYLDSSSNNRIFNNTFMDNSQGIYLISSSYNVIEHNEFIWNSGYGIYISSSLSNGGTGANPSPSAHNLIFHNNFINTGARDDATDNDWNDVYPSGGNYWHSGSCPDAFSGIATPQTTGGSDGICDLRHNITVYEHANGTIDINGVDHYPLKNPTATRLLLGDAIPPVADAGYNTTLYLGQGYFSRFERSTDNIAVFNWTWNITKDGENVITLYGRKPFFEFKELGTYRILLTVRDYAGNEDTDEMTITVELEPDYSQEQFFEALWPWMSLFFIIIFVVGTIIYSLWEERRNKSKRGE